MSAHSSIKIGPARLRRGIEDAVVLNQQAFLKSLDLEDRRVERSGRAFVLLLVQAPGILSAPGNVSAKIAHGFCGATRATDIKGWYEENSTFGIIFTEIDPGTIRSAVDHLSTKMSNVLGSILSAEQLSQVQLAWFAFPEDWDKWTVDKGWDSAASEIRDSKKLAHVAKRCIDIGVSLTAIVLFAPVLGAAAIAIKVTSKGPILFRQIRQGLYGRPFTFLKFRSMSEKNNSSVHEEYMRRLISGDPAIRQADGRGKTLYKMTNDARVTPVGRLLRRTSIDELPQFFNVLKGEMSLVGPRPPIPYEVANYKTWHKRRLRDVKPGITGLWQVKGRSSTTFDEMVRLDLQYGHTWSIWLDLKILLHTPWAVLMGSGAR